MTDTLKGPDALIIGAAKAGTTSLARLLDSHPDIAMAAAKEPRFFNRYADWRERLPDYLELFRNAQDAAIRFEASPAYGAVSEYPDTPARIYAFNPDMKLILIARHPLERLVSHFRHLHTMDPARAPDLKRALAHPGLTDTLITRSDYGATLDAYEKLFGEDAIKTLILEDIQSKPDSIRPLYDHLEISQPITAPVLPVKNRGAARQKRSPLPLPALGGVEDIPRDLAIRLMESGEAFLERIGRLADVWREVSHYDRPSPAHFIEGRGEALAVFVYDPADWTWLNISPNPAEALAESGLDVLVIGAHAPLREHLAVAQPMDRYAQRITIAFGPSGDPGQTIAETEAFDAAILIDPPQSLAPSALSVMVRPASGVHRAALSKPETYKRLGSLILDAASPAQLRRRAQAFFDRRTA